MKRFSGTILCFLILFWCSDLFAQACSGNAACVGYSTGSLGFGNVPVGSSAVLRFQIRVRLGNDLSVFKISSANPAFKIVGGPTPPFCIPKGAANIDVEFTPPQAGNFSSQIRIDHGDFECEDGVDFITVSGTGVGGVGSIAFSPSSLNFGEVRLGDSEQRSFQIRNTTPFSLNIQNIYSTNNDFVVRSPSFPRAIGPGGQLSVIAQFTPSKSGNINGRLNVSSGNLVIGSLSLSGEGLRGNPDINLSPREIDFGQTEIGTFNVRSFQISNSGESDLVVTIPQDPFVKTNPKGTFNIRPRGNTNVQIKLIANAAGLINRTLRIQSNDPDESQLSIALRANGTEGNIGLLDRSGSSGIQNGNVNQTTGVQSIDFNGDGRLDIYLTGQNGNLLFRNIGNNRFTNVTNQARLNNAGRLSRGASWGDVDNDGDLDLFIANFDGPSAVMKNNRNVFANQGGALGIFAADNTPRSTGGIWFDFNNDGRLDLFVVKDAAPNQLFKNVGAFQFANIAGQAGVAFNGPGRGAVAADFNDDGFQDLYIVNSGRANKLYINNRNETFRDASNSSGADFVGQSSGAAVADYDGDGDIDIFVANSNGPSVLFRNQGNGRFQRATASAGLTLPKKAAGASFSDFDNDGDEDLIIVQKPGENLLFRNSNGRFSRVTNVDLSNSDNPSTVVAGDSNNDGTPDVVIGDSDGSQNQGDSIYQNAADGNNWLVLTLQGTRSNRSAIGAKILLRTGILLQAKLVSGGNGQSQESLPLEFGLGQANTATISIFWPSGAVQSLENVNANQRIRITEPNQ